MLPKKTTGSISLTNKVLSLQKLGLRLNWWVEMACAALLAVIVIDVWIGVVARYFFNSSLPWTEELARYLMIWMALLAVSSGIVRREHIGLEMLFKKLPKHVQRPLLVVIDFTGILFFAVLFWWGVKMTASGSTQYANIFSMTMTVPFLAIPVSSAIAIMQLIIAGMVDFYHPHLPAAERANA